MPIGKIDDSKLSDKDWQRIKSLYWIDCDLIKEGKIVHTKVCPEHEVRHNRLPDMHTFKILTDEFPELTLTEWAGIYSVSRQAVDILLQRIQKEYQTDINYSTRRRVMVYGDSPDLEKFNLYCDLIANKTTVPLNSIYKIVDLTIGYVNYWSNKVPEIKTMIDDAKKLRNLNKRNPISQTCYICRIELPIEEFGYDKQTLSGRAKRCRKCNYATVRSYDKIRAENFDPSKLPVEKWCNACEQTKPRSKFSISKQNGDGLQTYCNACTKKNQFKSSKRKQKFIDAGFTKSLYKCRNCKCERPAYYFYLLRTFSNKYRDNDETYISEFCRACLQEFHADFNTRYEVDSKMMQLQNCLKANRNIKSFEELEVLFATRLKVELPKKNWKTLWK